MTLWSSFFGLSFALLAWLGPILVASGGVAAFFLGHAGYMLLCALLLYRLLPVVAPETALPLNLAGLVRQHGLIYRSPRIAAPAMGFFFYTMLYVAVLTLLPPLMGDQRVLAATAMPLMSIAVSLTFGVWGLRYLSAVHLVQVGFALSLVSAVVLGFAWDMPLVRHVAALAMISSLGLVQGASFASIPQLNASAGDRALAAGAVAQLGNLGTTSGTPILAMLIPAFGSSGVVAFVAPLCLLGIIIHAVQSRRRTAP